MKRLLMILALCCFSVATPAATLSAHEARQFSADLDWLAEHLPKRHANLYHSTPKANFEAAIASLRARLPSLSRHAAIVEFARLFGLARDGHSALFLLPFPGASPIAGIRQLPLQLYQFDDGLRIVAIQASQRQWLGARVTAIGGVPIADAWQRVLPLLPRDNEMGEREYGAWYLALYEVLEALGLAQANRVELSVQHANGTAALQLQPMTDAPDAGWASQLITLPGPRGAWVGATDGQNHRWLARADQAWWFEMLDEGTLYAQINLLREGSETMASFAEALLTALPADGKLIIDLRLNRGGNGDLRWPLIHSLLRRPELRAPGRVRVLTSRRTFSAAQMLANDLERHLNATFIGEPTGSSPNHYGELGQLTLPQTGLAVAVSLLYWQHDPRDSREWIAPHRAVPLRYADLAEGRDAVLEAALTYTPPPTLASVMGTHLAEGRVDQAISAFQALAKGFDNPYRKLFEKELNDLGYGLMGEQRHSDAIAILRIATQLYPQSWNAWDSLGEAYALAGVRARAAFCYARSVQLNPQNTPGAAALQRLLQRR